MVTFAQTLDARGTSPVLGHPLFQVACGVAAFFLGIFNFALLNAAIRLEGNDFGKFYYSWHAWRVGWSLYSPTSATHMEVGKEYVEFLNMNPPHFHLIVWPFAWMSLRTAAYLWMVANVLALVASAILIIRELHLQPRWRHLLPITAAVLACGATGAIAITGQFTGFLLLPLAIAWRSARRGEEAALGMWLGLLISIKPFLALFVPVLAVRRQWLAATTSMAALIGCFVLGLAVFGLPAHRDWILALTNVDWSWAAMNGSWQGLLARSLGPSPYASTLTNAPHLIRPLWLLAAGITGLATLLASRRSINHAFAGTVLGALLISPLGWVYYIWLVLPGAVGLWRHNVPTIARVGLVALLVPYFGPLLGRAGPWATLTIGSVYTWATLALWIGVLATRNSALESSPP